MQDGVEQALFFYVPQSSYLSWAVSQNENFLND